MENYRATKAVIRLGAITRNTQKVIATYPGYKYYMAVVKADCYGYRGNKVVQAMIDGGANCLAASLLEEGLQLRQQFPTVPILLFTPVAANQLSICAEYNLWVTVANQQQAEDASQVLGLNTVIRVNGGSDILGGPTNKEDFHRLWNTLNSGVSTLTGLYLHNYNAEDEADTQAEYATFEALTQGLDISSLQLVSISNSLSLPRYERKPYSNACRLGNILYAIESNDPNLEPTFSLESQVLSTFTLQKGKSLAYSRAYTAEEDRQIAVVPIGFGDGFSKTNIGRNVFINGKPYPILTVTMDIINIGVDHSVVAGDPVILIRDHHHLDEISQHIHGATEEPITNLNKRIYRQYIYD